MPKPASVATLAALAFLLAAPASFAEVIITQRASLGHNELFAGSGGVVDRREFSDADYVSLTGPFAFSDSGAVDVYEDQPFSNGTAIANASIATQDLILQPTPRSLAVTSSRSSNAMAEWFAGTGTASYRQESLSSVRFQIIDTNVHYFATGVFNPDPDASTAYVSLYRPFVPNPPFRITEPGVVNETGILTAGLTYEFQVRLVDGRFAAQSVPVAASASSYDLRFVLIPVNCRSDLNANGSIDFGDLNILLSNFGTANALADIDGDGTVAFGDLNALLSVFGTVCP